MWQFILVSGGIFFALLFGMVYAFEHADVTSLTQLTHLQLGAKDGLSTYELSLIFTTFVMLQFWNMFNARAFATHRSALHLGKCGEFIFILLVIFIGQIIIVECGGQFFSVTPLTITDWLLIIGSTSLVLWFGELYRLLSPAPRPRP
jgi:Ca2+-transporting ATPase